MLAVVDQQPTVLALPKILLRSKALHIVQDDRSFPRSKLCRAVRPYGSTQPDHSANDKSIVDIPEIIADGSPRAIVEDFDTSFLLCGSTNKPCLQFWNSRWSFCSV